MKHRLPVLLLLAGAVVQSAHAGILFGKKAKKSSETDRVPELVNTVKSDGDEDKRTGAARELRQYDPAKYPYLVPILVDVLLSDKKPSVRAEAAQSLGKIRPISQQAGLALEQALTKDTSMRVRLQARSALMQYHWAGYHGQGIAKDDTLLQQSKEPPLADSSNPPPANNLPPQVISTAEPPLSSAPVPAGRIVPQAGPLPMPMPPGNPVPPRAETSEPPAIVISPTTRSTVSEPPTAPPTTRSTVSEPPTAPPAPATPAAPASGGSESGPDLTPPN
jgi:hypothetical protein